MKSRRNNTSEENRAAGASLLADLEEEYSAFANSVPPKIEQSKMTTVIKVGTNQEQSGTKIKLEELKVGTKWERNREQKWEPTGNQLGTKWEQTAMFQL